MTLIPNRGAFVSDLAFEGARDIFFSRRTIEAQLVRRLSASRTPDALTRLGDQVAPELAASDRGDRR